MRIGIVTTTKNAGRMTEDFVRYHSAVGFDRIYLFFDDPADASLARCIQYPAVRAIQHDDALRNRWKELASKDPYYRPWLKGINRAHESRQVLNVGIAFLEAQREEVDWLLHIDIDELFYSSKAAVRDYFAELSATGVRSIQFPNCEALPEALEVESPFVEQTLFKVSPLQLGATYTRWFVRHFPERRSYFLAYDGWKSAAQVDSHPRGDLHMLETTSRLDLARLAVAGLSAKVLLGEHINEVDFAIQERVHADPTILHFPCPSLSRFEARYRARLAHMDDLFLGQRERLAQIEGGFMHFELAACEMMKSAPERARAFFEEQVMYSPRDLSQLERRGAIRRILGPSEILRDATRMEGGS